jgi:hypothetical protein
MKIFPIFYLIFLLIALKPVSSQQLVINEFMSSNSSTLQDSDGDFSDWIEFYNAGEVALDLEGYMISDDTLVPEKWIFPSINMMPGKFLVIFASDKNRYDTAELHTNFKIKSGGEYLLLSNREAEEIDRIDPVALSSDISYGRYPDGSDDLLIMVNPTPGNTNTPGASVLNVSVSAGFFNAPFKVGISSTNEDDIIYYTLDGSLPGPASFVYTDSIYIGFTNTVPNNISTIPTTPDPMHDHFRKWTPPEGLVPKANVLRAVAYNGDIPGSRVVTNTYFVDNNSIEKHPYHIISITTDSISLFGFEKGIYVPGVYFDSTDTDWTGNYFQKGSDWERPLHFEYFEDSGHRALNQECAMRIHGKITRHSAQKTLRLYSQSENGNGYFNYPFMRNTEQDKFKRILLRTTYADGSQTVFKDAMIQDLVKDFNFEMMHYNPVTVFINGEYWGIHTIRERIDKYYILGLYDVIADSLDMLKNNMTVEEGNAEDYQDMINYIEENDLAEEEHYEYIKTRMDVDNYIDYLIVELYFGNIDWPGSNVRYWRERKEGAKWRWILFDLDNTCFDYTFNSLDYATFEGDTSWQNPSWATFLFRNLLKNEDFEEQFLNRFAFHLSHSFQTDTLVSKIEEFTNLYGQGIEAHIQRWNFPRSLDGWLGDIDWVLKRFAEKRPCMMTGFILEHFDITAEEFGFICDTGIGNLETKRIIYPNPACSTVKVKIDEWQGDIANLRIYNEMGQGVLQRTLNISSGQVLDEVDVSGLSPGIYFFGVFGRNQSVVTKMIKTLND